MLTDDGEQVGMLSLNESPYEKVGKFYGLDATDVAQESLNESPYEKVGKLLSDGFTIGALAASMKVPTKK